MRRSATGGSVGPRCETQKGEDPMSNPRRVFLTLVALVLVGCGAPALPKSEHPVLGQVLTSARGWRAEADHMGEWISVPVPGKVTVIDFWSTTCEPCIREMPVLERLWRESDPAKVQVVGVAVDEEPGAHGLPARIGRQHGRPCAIRKEGPFAFPS